MAGKRTYERTHPWITFDLGTSRYSNVMWMLLGEAVSKAKHIAGVPLEPEAAKELMKVFLAKGARATTAIEGNTLTEEQVLAQVEGKLEVPPSQQYLKQEVQNIIDACMAIAKRLDNENDVAIDAKFICELNSMVLKGLDLEEGVSPGQIRRHSVMVGRYRGAPPEDCQFLLEQLASHIQAIDCDGDDKAHLAILTALFAHIYLALIHPFGDGNGRTSRMLEYYILLKAGFAQPIGHLLSNHYNITRSRYYSELDGISKSGGDVRSFVNYALEGFVDGLKEQIKFIRVEQHKVTWKNFVHEQFAGQKTASDLRRLELILAISAHGQGTGPIRIAELMELTPRVARDYAGKTDKTLTRDINALVGMGLLSRGPGRTVWARADLTHAFVPWARRIGPVAPKVNKKAA